MKIKVLENNAYALPSAGEPNITTVKGAHFSSLDFMKAPGDLVQCSQSTTIKKYNLK